MEDLWGCPDDRTTTTTTHSPYGTLNFSLTPSCTLGYGYETKTITKDCGKSDCKTSSNYQGNGSSGSSGGWCQILRVTDIIYDNPILNHQAELIENYGFETFMHLIGHDSLEYIG